MVRISGELTPLPMADPLTPDDTAQAVREMLRDPARMQEMETEGEADFAYAVPGLARFRVNAFRQRGSISIVCRRIPYGVTTIAELGLPDAVREMAEEPRGIVLVTGTTGSGKSTTLAAMVDHVNTTAARHIVTIEDPIEFLHADKRSVINQREVGSDTGSFGRALRRVLRQDPDIILIGEMRDEETVRTALSAAETGHLVLSTLHTADAPETINRVIDFFPPHQHRQVRAMLSASLRGVISQRLVPSMDGGRVAALEILRTTGRVRDAIMNPEETAQLPSIIAEGVVLRDADVRPGPVRARAGGSRHARERSGRCHESSGLQAAARRRGPRGYIDGRCVRAAASRRRREPVAGRLSRRPPPLPAAVRGHGLTPAARPASPSAGCAQRRRAAATPLVAASPASRYRRDGAVPASAADSALPTVSRRGARDRRPAARRAGAGRSCGRPRRCGDRSGLPPVRRSRPARGPRPRPACRAARG